MARMKFQRIQQQNNRLTTRTKRNFINYALFTVTAILVLITAHAKSAQLDDNTLPLALPPVTTTTTTTTATRAPATTTTRTTTTTEEEAVAVMAVSPSINPASEVVPAEGDHDVREPPLTGNLGVADEQQHHQHHHHHHQQHHHHHRNENSLKVLHETKTDNHQHHHHHHHHHHHQKQQEHQQEQHRQHQHLYNDVKRQRYHSKYTIEELLHMKFQTKVSNDIDMDPCKAGGFMGDIALPDLEYSEPVVAHTVEWQPQADAPAPEPETEVPTRGLPASIKFNATFQQELEILKQEVYHEGLQVEEEGLTHIIRKKTKLPNAKVEHSYRSDPILSANELVKQTGGSAFNADYMMKSSRNEVISSEDGGSHQRGKVSVAAETEYFEPRISVREKPISVRVVDDVLLSVGGAGSVGFVSGTTGTVNSGSGGSSADGSGSAGGITLVPQNEKQPVNNARNTKAIKPPMTMDVIDAKVPSERAAAVEKLNKSTVGWNNRNVDQRKIQSNTKDIEDDSGNNFVAERKVVILPTSLPTQQRSTLPNVYSDAGGNGMKLDDVEILHAEGVVRRRHRRGRKNRRSSELRSDYTEKLRRLRDELNRPVRTMREYRRAHRKHQQHQQRRQQVTAKKHDLNKFHSSNDNGVTDAGKTKHPPPKPVQSAAYNSDPQSSWMLDGQAAPKSLNYSTEMVAEPTAMAFASKDTITAVVDEGSLDAAYTQSTETVSKPQHHHRMTRAVTAKKERIWDYGVIPYEIDGNFSGLHKALFKQAMRHWENSTCIKFVERDPEIHPNYIVFTVRSCGCCSFVGKRGNGAQAISIGRNCDKFGIVVHELGHVVGFWHEHTRPDREKHVVIELNNIMKGQDYNFNKLTEDDVDSLGMAYDYDSIMHYARNTFSKGTYLDTILPIEMKGRKRPEIGQRLRLSLGDIAQANLLYKCPRCGRTFQENTGIFASPAYYTAGALTNETEHCEWRITATHGERVVLRLENLNIFKSNNCQTDYLEVRDGYYFKSPLIGRYCGKVNNEILTTETSRMLLTYVNTHRTEGFRGFKAEYDVICGGELSVDDSEGRLESPNYPLEYLPNKECVWKITVPKGYQVALKFQSFEVENHDSCVYDFVEVRDGPSQESSLIGVFCGYKPPPNMKSSGHSMFVKFVSDTSVQKAGFSAIFMKEVDECETQNHGCEHDCINTLGGYECSCHIGYELHSDKKHCEDACGGVIEYPNGTITSPSFPDTYPLLKDCIWEIIAPPKHKISLNFTHFDLEGTTHQQSDCGYDSVTIYSKLSENRLKRIGTFCGNSLPPTATSEGNALRVEFHSDKSIQRSGFAAVFFTDIDECSINNGGCQHECRNTIGSYMCLCHNGYSLHENGHDCKEGECKHEISGYYGTIYSPNYPDFYPPNADCVWHFATTPGHRIKLIFNEFNVESHQECAYDNVAIYDGDSESSSILGRFCGDKIPYPISSSTNQLYMVLKTDKNKQLNGFTAIHSTSCGGYLRATSQIQQFYSHARFGNHNYNENMDCEWTIQAPSNGNVQLFFLTFDIEPSENCTYDYVQVYSGMEDTSGPMYGQYCGNTLPQDIISLTDSLLVRFKTDNSITMKGFSASYVAVDPFENSDEDINSYSSEMVTPFPGSLKSIYKEDETQESDDYSDFSENHLSFVRPYMPRIRYQNRL